MAVSHVPLPQLIDPTAVVHPNAELHPTVQVGAYSVIGEGVKIGPHTVVGAHVVIDGWTEIGARNRIFPGAILGSEPQDLKYDGSVTMVKIGDDNCIREYVTINRATNPNAATRIGNGNLLMAYVHVAHDCFIEDQVIVATHTTLAGHVRIESQARLSGVLGVHQFTHIGRHAMVGGMSRIDRDVPPYMLVEGNPSRVRAINRIGLERAGLPPESLSALDSSHRLLYRQGLTLAQAMEKLESMPDAHVQHLFHFLRQSTAGGSRRGPIPGRN